MTLVLTALFDVGVELEDGARLKKVQFRHGLRWPTVETATNLVHESVLLELLLAVNETKVMPHRGEEGLSDVVPRRYSDDEDKSNMP